MKNFSGSRSQTFNGLSMGKEIRGFSILYMCVEGGTESAD